MTANASTALHMNAAYTEQAESVGKKAFGFWLYLMSDLILFSGIFATYGVVGRNFAGGPTGKTLFDLYYTFGETMCLLFSSACCGLAILAVRGDKKGAALGWLVVTFLLGLGFVGMEIHEFYGMILDGNGPTHSAFLSGFFTLVGTHGTHVTFGLIWMAVMIGQILVKGLTAPVRSRLMRLSMFWHFLDIVWIGVFTFVYLAGVM